MILEVHEREFARTMHLHQLRMPPRGECQCGVKLRGRAGQGRVGRAGQGRVGSIGSGRAGQGRVGSGRVG